MLPLVIFTYLLLERLFELLLSRKHYREQTARGGREFYPESFPRMIALHTLFLGSLLGESYPWQIANDLTTQALLGMFVVLQGGRYWCILSLGRQWNTRIVLVPGDHVTTSGPYRFLSHPNYLIVSLEFLVIPLLLQTPLTLLIFFPANIYIVRQRIRLEESALREFTDYNQQFPQK